MFSFLCYEPHIIASYSATVKRALRQSWPWVEEWHCWPGRGDLTRGSLLLWYSGNGLHSKCIDCMACQQLADGHGFTPSPCVSSFNHNAGRHCVDQIGKYWRYSSRGPQQYRLCTIGLVWWVMVGMKAVCDVTDDIRGRGCLWRCPVKLKIAPNFHFCKNCTHEFYWKRGACLWKGYRTFHILTRAYNIQILN